MPPIRTRDELREMDIVAAIDRLTAAVEKHNRLVSILLLDNAEGIDSMRISDTERIICQRYMIPVFSTRNVTKAKIREIDPSYLPLEPEEPTHDDARKDIG